MNLPPENTFEEFQNLCFEGIPEQYRAKSWKILLKLIPFEERDCWLEIDDNHLNNYYQFFDQFINDPTGEEIAMLKQLQTGNKPDSTWNHVISDFELLEQIDRDVKRTFPDLAFFQKEIHQSPNCQLYTTLKHKRRALVHWLKHSKTEPDFGVRRRTLTSPIPSDTPECHWEAIERILYLYCKVNPGIGYVQGMNNIIAPIYFVCANDIDTKRNAEAESFFLFAAIMSELRDLFSRSMDEITFEPAIEHSLSESSIGSSLGDFAVPIPDEARTKGVGSTMDKLMSLIEKVDEELYENMVYKTNKKSKRLEPLFFAFRWVSVMFTQEFNLPDIIRIWDSVFSQVYGEPCLSHMQSFLSKLMDSDSSSVLDFLVQFSCAMLLCVKQEIISNDFGENMHLLQNYPVDIETIFKQLRGMRQKPKRRSISSVFEKLKRTSVKYRISNPFDSTVEVSESVLEKRDSLPKLPQLQTIKKTYELGSQDEVIELN